MELLIRRAAENDRAEIARVIAFSYEEDFAQFIKDMNRVAMVFESSIQIDRFFVASQDDNIIGIAACTDCTGRAIAIRKKDCTKHLGFIRGSIGYKIFANLFMDKLPYPSSTGYIEFVGVIKSARGKGIAKKIMLGIIEDTKYSEFILDVADTNIPAIKCYEHLGFVEFKRVSIRARGIHEKVYMNYVKH